MSWPTYNSVVSLPLINVNPSPSPSKKEKKKERRRTATDQRMNYPIKILPLLTSLAPLTQKNDQILGHPERQEKPHDVNHTSRETCLQFTMVLFITAQMKYCLCSHKNFNFPEEKWCFCFHYAMFKIITYVMVFNKCNVYKINE